MKPTQEKCGNNFKRKKISLNVAQNISSKVHMAPRIICK